MNNTGQAGLGVTGPYDTKIAGLYDLLDTLGSGHFAVVKLARHVFTGEKVAVKVIDKSKLDEVSKSHLFQEVRCMKLVQHPNVVRLYEVIDTQTKLYLILELGDGGDLYDYIMRHESGLSETIARDYFRQIVRAISYCHRLHVVHRDLKPENVVFFERLGVVKLTDFGFSNKFCPGQKLETSCGSLAYSAPEILLGDSYDAPAVDVWSLGVILYMLVCGQLPFQQANDSETLTMIMDCKYSMPQHVSSECKRLIGRMLVREPEKRATLNEIASDPWVTGGESVPPEHCDTPLVAREQLGEEERAAVVQKMVAGAIASKDEILQALEKNEYNHITATYYLLAERKLRSKRQTERERERVGLGARRPDALGVGNPGGGARGLLAPPMVMGPRTPHDQPPRSRKCSIVREEEDDEEGARSSGSAPRRPSRSEGRLHVAIAARPQPHRQLDQAEVKVDEPSCLSVEVPTVNIASTQPTPSPPALATNGVTSVAGAGEDAPPCKVPPPPPPARRQRIEVRRRRPRAGSCSSSDLSDDDSEKKKRAAEREGVAGAGLGRGARRDSHDDSSDSQERGAPPAARRQADAARPAITGSGGTNGAGAPSASGDARGGSGNGGGGGTGRRRRAARHESRLRESRSLNRIAEVEEVGGGRWGTSTGIVALCGRPFLRLLSAARPATSARRLHAC